MVGITPNGFKGTNYLPSTALSIAAPFGMLPDKYHPDGAYSRPYVEQEIAEIARAGFNSIRLHGASFIAWIIDRDAYMASLSHLAQVCNRNGIVITYQVWSTTASFDALGGDDYLSWFSLFGYNKPLLWGAVTSVVQSSRMSRKWPVPPGEPGQYVLFAEPGPTIATQWDRLGSEYGTMRELMARYVDDIGTFFASNPIGVEAYGSYDIYNEVDIYLVGFDKVTNRIWYADAVTAASVINLVAQTRARLREVHAKSMGAPVPTFTIGISTDNSARPSIFPKLLSTFQPYQDYVSYHATVDTIRVAAPIAQGHIRSQRFPMAHVVSEFWHTVCHDWQVGKIGEIIKRMEAWGATGQMWGYLETNAFCDFKDVPFPIDGIVRPIVTASSPLRFEVQHLADYREIVRWTANRMVKPKRVFK